MSGLAELLRAVCSSVHAGAGDAAGLAAGLGEVVEEQEGALRVRPRDERFADAYVARDGAGRATHVDLELARPGSVAELSDAFGEPSEPPALHPGPLRALIFDAGPCAVIARADDEDAVARVTVRHDAG